LKESPPLSPAAADESPAQRARLALESAREKAAARRSEREVRLRQDSLWVQAAQKGDADAFRKLVEANQGRLFAVALGMLKDRDEAMDAVQDAFIKAHGKLQTFEGNSAFSTWLHRICVNLCIDRQRARARRRTVNLEDAREADLSGDNIYGGDEISTKVRGQNPLQNATNKELGGEIQQAIALLSEEHRQVLLLREVEGMSYEEIAEVLEIPKGTIMSRLFHARRNMQRHLRPFLGRTD
jgi:RNA polymerase sigma-70 factor (ECF subfamily)